MIKSHKTAEMSSGCCENSLFQNSLNNIFLKCTLRIATLYIYILLVISVYLLQARFAARACCPNFIALVHRNTMWLLLSEFYNSEN